MITDSAILFIERFFYTAEEFDISPIFIPLHELQLFSSSLLAHFLGDDDSALQHVVQPDFLLVGRLAGGQQEGRRSQVAGTHQTGR